MAVPLQAVKTFRNGDGAESNQLILGDNLQVLRRLMQVKEAGKLRNADGVDGVRLCYLDPPFATGEAWETRAGRVAYIDRVKGAEFIEWMRRRLILMTELLSADGSIVIHLDQRYVHYMKVIMDELLPGNFRNEIVVPRGIKGVQQQFETIDALAQGHYTLLLYSKSTAARYRKLLDPGVKPGKWDTFWRGTNRRTMRYELFGITPDRGQWRWKKERTEQAVANYERYLSDAADEPIEVYAARIEEQAGERPDFVRLGDKGQPQWYQYSGETRLASDVWSQVRTRGDETGYPTEKHEELLERLIEWLTQPGDLVLDPFVGSGTTVAVAQRKERRWIGIDCGKYAIYTTQTRLLRQSTDGAEPLQPFTLYNAGLYDYAAVHDLSWEDFRRFALQLFQCRDVEEEVAGVRFDGFLGDHRVLVYNFKEHPKAKIGEGFVEDLARICGSRLGSRCFIIAPALVVEPYEDYLDVEGIRFFFLRIPYSIIAELHKRAFSQLKQPASKDLANATIDSVGFDFIQPPRVECSYQAKRNTLVARIIEFESEAFAAVDSEDDIADLAMVLVDYDFKGDVFDLDEVHYAEDLKEDRWQVAIPKDEVGDQIMLIYLDVYGNEHRETKRAADFGAPAKKRRASKQPSRKAGKGSDSARTKGRSATRAAGSSNGTRRQKASARRRQRG